MTEAAQSARKPSASDEPMVDEADVTALVKHSGTTPEVVKRLYEEELAALRAKARVKNFVGVIAGRRVRNQLAALKRK